MLGIAILLLSQDEPKIDYLLKPDPGVAIVRFSDPKKGETPEIESEGGLVTWIAVDAERGWGVARLDGTEKELKVRSGGRTSNAAPLAGAKTVNWGELTSEVSVEPESSGRTKVKNRSRGMVFAILKRDAKVVSAVIVIPGGDKALETPPDGELILVLESGTACRMPVPRARVEEPVRFDWEPLGPFAFGGISVTAKATFADDFGGNVDHRQEQSGQKLFVDGDRYDFTGWEADLRVDFGVLEFTFAVGHANGDGQGKGTYDDGILQITGDSDFDIETWRFGFFVGRRLGGLLGPWFRIEIRADLGVAYIGEELTNGVVHTGDMILGDQTLDGSSGEWRAVFAAKAGIETQADLGRGWTLVAIGEVEGDIDKGAVWSVGAGVGKKF